MGKNEVLYPALDNEDLVSHLVGLYNPLSDVEDAVSVDTNDKDGAGLEILIVIQLSRDLTLQLNLKEFLQLLIRLLHFYLDGHHREQS